MMNKKHDPEVAPGIDNDDELEAKATEREIQEGDTTSVTRLVADHTPED